MSKKSIHFDIPFRDNNTTGSRKKFDLSPVHLDIRTKSGLVTSQGKNIGIGNLEETDYRIHRAIQNMLKQRERLPSTKKSAKSIKGGKNNGFTNIESSLKVTRLENDLRMKTQSLLKSSKYRNSVSVKSNSDIEFAAKLNDSKKLLPCTNELKAGEITKLEPTILGNVSALEEDKLFAIRKTKDVEREILLSKLKDRKLKIKEVLDATDSLKKTELALNNRSINLQDPLFEIEKKSTAATKIVGIINTTKSVSLTLSGSLVENIKNERKRRIDQIQRQTKLYEWNEVLAVIKNTREILFKKSLEDLDYEIDGIVDQIISLETQ
eukprot:NODE_514_length_6598_cov_0.571011.p2 type:complete len:323 gc:universal NODE_514_length_6598_cov_0.571011:1208-240(-)